MNCDLAALKSVLEIADDSSPELEVVAEHVETCAECRQTLTELGGDDACWNEASQWLTHNAEHETDDEPRFPFADLSFLEPPTSPEMLGNIGRYEVESFLGQGGMGIVLRAHDSDLQRTVAVKVLAPQWSASPTARRRFAREAQAAASVAHENVIPIYNVEAAAPLPYLVMRYVPGMTLQQWVRGNDEVDVGTILRVAGQMAEGLAAAHRRGLIHRDIKPANVLVGENIERVWITDFGLARAADSMTLTQTGVIAGTPHYMSPEQARGEPIDQRSDLFSFGCVLFFMCTGRPPFDAENTLAVLHRIVHEQPPCVTEVRDDLPPSFVKLIRQLLEPSVEWRTKDCGEIIERLELAQQEHRSGKCHKRSTKAIRPAFVVAGACAAILAVASLFYYPKLPIDSKGRVLPVHSFIPSRSLPPIESPPGRDQAIVMAAKRITDSLDDSTLTGEINQVQQYLSRLSTPDAWTAANPFLSGDAGWQATIRRLDNELAAAGSHSEFSFDTLVDPLLNWSSEQKRIQTTIDNLKRSEPFSSSPF